MPENWDEKHLSHSNESQKPDSVPATARDHAISSRGIPFGSGLGKYRILDRVRTSHHAIVYNARDAMLDRLVVIKQLNPGLLDDPLACGDFKREAQLLARVPKDARNVIGIHELIGEDQGLFIVEEFVSGDWLEMLISKRKVGLADALRLLKYGCLGMRSLHSRKIVHRDMQPTSLLLSDNGQLRIGNFACAIHEGDHTPPPIIQTKYAAPELQMGMPHDDRVDIYSLGMTVFEVCVGRKTLHAHFSAITSDVQASVERWRQWHVDMSAMLPNARVLNPAVPPALASILHKMTTKDLDERYASAEEVLQDIIRKFNAPRANVTPALPQASPWQFVAEAAPGLPNVSAQPKAHSSVAKQSSLMHLVKTEKTTTTHSVQPEAQAIVAKEPVRKSEPQKPAPTPAHPRSTAPRTPPTPTPTITPAHPTRAARPRSVTTRVASISAPISVPAHTPVVEPLRKQRRIFLPAAAAILLAASIWAGGSFWWTQSGKRPALKSVESMIEAGMALYRAGDFQKARETFLKVIVTANDNPQLAAEWNRADTMQLLVDGQLALQRNEFDKVEIALSEASMRGADVSALASLKSHFHAKRDALRLSAEGVKAVEAGQFIDAEAKITDYEQNAKYAGLDPDTLKTKLYQEREKREYDHALERARKALAEDDFDGATIALRDAQVIRNSTATRRLQQEIFDAKSRHDWMVRGDKAMNEKDFAAAESAYQSANAIDPTDEIEQKLNMASSMRLYNEAGDEIRAGNLLNARKKLENALWKYANKAARAKLTALTKAFEAAQLVERGDQELSRKNFEEAIRLYEKAIPDLIAPADEMAKAKLNEARQQKSQSTKG